ncbi:MAG: hypothetical protein QUS08_05905 [Methanothrix sp.]|nr:hypothetical protein [Methanothrix sp.]
MAQGGLTGFRDVEAESSQASFRPRMTPDPRDARLERAQDENIGMVARAVARRAGSIFIRAVDMLQ